MHENPNRVTMGSSEARVAHETGASSDLTPEVWETLIRMHFCGKKSFPDFGVQLSPPKSGKLFLPSKTA